MKCSIFLLSLLILFSCHSTLDTNYIRATGWSYDGGYRVTDFINFKPGLGFDIRADTIFLDNIPRAVIIKLDKKKYTLSVRSLDGKQTGYYFDERGMLN